MNQSDFKPVPPLTRAELDDLIIRAEPEDVIEALFQPAYDKFNFRQSDMTDGDIIVYTVCSFYLEVSNGGIVQFFYNPSGSFAHHCAPSLRQIGARRYAEVVEQSIAAFTEAVSVKDDRWHSDLDAYCEQHDDPFEEIEKPFWEMYSVNARELEELLFAYICQHRDLFAPQQINT